MVSSKIQFEKMTKSSIPKLICSLSVPTVISALISVIYNTADTFFVSSINKSAAAGVGVVFSIMSVIQAVGYGLSMGAGSLISLSLGAKQNSNANKYSSSAFFAAFLFGGIVGAIGLIFSKPILTALGSTSTMLPYAYDYALFILIASPLSCASFVLNGTLRSEGNTLLAMIGIGIGGIINIGLDPLFIFALGMGTKGASLATAVSQSVSFVILLIQFLRKRTVVTISVKYVSKKVKDYLKIFSTGLPTVFRQGLGAVSSALLNIQAVVYGDAAVAAITIANKIYMFIRNLILGIGQGFQPVAGYNFGAGKVKRVKKAFIFATFLGTLIATVSAISIGLFAESIMWWFCKDVEVASIGKLAVISGCFVMPLLAFSTYTNQLFQSLGFKAKATFLASCRQGIFFIPTILLAPHFIGLKGIQTAQPIADFITFIVSIPFFISFFKKYDKDFEVDKT